MSAHEQGTDEWFEDRLGKVTASRIVDVMAKTRSGYSAARANYMSQLAIERITQVRTESYTNAAMQWGTETEPEARSQYEIHTGKLVAEVGMIPHPTIEMAGASPDGVVGDGLLEIKCPNSATHIETLRTKTIQRKYILQMQFQMACTGAKWCDFVSYDPRMPEGLDFYLQRVERDDDLIEEIESEVGKFLNELEQMVHELEEMKNGITQSH